MKRGAPPPARAAKRKPTLMSQIHLDEARAAEDRLYEQFRGSDLAELERLALAGGGARRHGGATQVPARHRHLDLGGTHGAARGDRARPAAGDAQQGVLTGGRWPAPGRLAALVVHGGDAGRRFRRRVGVTRWRPGT